MTHHHIITDEQLDALTSEYITRDTATLIVNSVRLQEEGINKQEIEKLCKASQAQILKRLYRWIQYDTKDNKSLVYFDQQMFDAHSEAYRLVCAVIEKFQLELIPELNTFSYNSSDES